MPCDARPERDTGCRRGSAEPVLFHPDYTVGLGITPNLLTLRIALRRSRALGMLPSTAGGELHPALRTRRPDRTDSVQIDKSKRLFKQVQS